MNSRVIISSGSAYYRDGNRVWLPPIEWKSLKQWWGFLENVVLAKPELNSSKVPDGWLEVPIGVEVYRLCASGDGRLSRRRDTAKAAGELLRPTDILMARMPYYETYWCYLAAQKKGIRHFVEIHGDWETAVLDEDGSSIFRKVTRKYRANANRKSLSMMSASALCAVCIGPKLAEKYVPSGVPVLATTNHLLNEREYRHRVDSLLSQPPKLLFAGDMQRRKGLHILFKALQYLKSEGRSFEMIMVGSGPMVEDLKSFSVKNGFGNAVQFVGRVAHGEVLYDYFKKADIFVLPSIAAEGVPRVTHEAMAFGCPVIATDIGSVAWQLDGGAGIVVPPGDAKLLAEAITKLFDNPGLRRSIAKKGFECSLEHSYEKQEVEISQFINANLSFS